MISVSDFIQISELRLRSKTCQFQKIFRNRNMLKVDQIIFGMEPKI